MAKGRAKGTGYIYKDPKSGIFHVQWTINGQRRRKSLGVTHRRDKTLADGTVIKGAEAKASELLLPGLEARRKEDVIVKVAEQKGIIQAGDLSLADALGIFAPLYRQSHTIGDATFLNYERQWNRFVEWVRGNHPEITGLRQVTEEIAREYWSLFAYGAASTANQHLTTLKVVFSVLRNRAGLLLNPWDGITRRAGDGVPREYLTPEDREKIFASFGAGGANADRDSEYRIMFQAGCYIGQRLGDCCLLQKSEVDFKKRQIVLKPSKTRRINRMVIVPFFSDAFRDELRAWIDALPADGQDIFPKLAAAYRKRPKTVKDETSEIFKAAGFATTVMIPGRKQSTCVIGFHSFRGTLATDLLNAGVPPSIVSAIIGDNISTLEKHYVKVNQKHVHDAVKKVLL